MKLDKDDITNRNNKYLLTIKFAEGIHFCDHLRERQKKRKTREVGILAFLQ